MHVQRGFTLVEILVVLAAVGILASIAYPTYGSYLVKGRRAEAQAALLELMQKQERYYTEHNTYVAFSADAAANPEQLFKWFSGSAAATSAYELSGKACPGQTLSRCIELFAVPGTSRVDGHFRDGECQTLTLDSEGAQGATGAAPRCWP
jgi:type IV pilus assembly protein PilE